NFVVACGRTIDECDLLCVRRPGRRCRSERRRGDGTAAASVPLGPPKNGVRNCDVGNPLAIAGVGGVIGVATGKNGCELARSPLTLHLSRLKLRPDDKASPAISLDERRAKKVGPRREPKRLGAPSPEMASILLKAPQVLRRRMVG